MQVIKEFYYRFKQEYSMANEKFTPEQCELYKSEIGIYLDILQNYEPLKANEGFCGRQLRHLYIRKFTRCLNALDKN